MASFSKRSNGWEFRISYKDNEGNYRRKAGGGFKTKALANHAAAKAELELLHPEIAAADMTLVDYVENWAEVYRQPNITVVTWQKYKEAINRMKKYFGNTKISQMTPTKYQLVINDLSAKYSQNTLNNFHYPIKNAVKAAIREHVLTEDFTEGAIIKSSKEGKPIDEKFLQLDEYQHVIEVTRNRFETESYFFIYLLATTGLRFAEAQGLTWDDIVFKTDLILVNKTWNNYITHDFAPTKNKSSVREVPISRDVADALEEYRDKYWKKNEYNRLLSNISNNAVNKALRVITKRNVHCHSLRHTYASYLIANGVDLMTVSRILGHENLNITLKVYAHILDEYKEKNHDDVRRIFMSSK
jgi:integrase